MQTEQLVEYGRRYWELVQEDEIVRYGSIAGTAVLWLAIALTNVALLGVLPLVAASVVLLRRHRREETGVAWREDELDDLY